MNKFLTIAKAWGIAVFHTDEQKELADKRSAVCSTCPSLQEVDVKNMTGGLVNKIYTPIDSPKEQKCPLEKWEN